MLNELKQLSQSLLRAGVDLPYQDDRFSSYGKKTAFIAYIDESGTIQRLKVEPDRDAAKRYLKFETSTGGSRPSTPGFNTQALLKVRDGNEELFSKTFDSLKKAKPTTEQFEIVERLLTLTVSNWDSKNDSTRKKIAKSVQSASKTLLDGLAKSSDSRVDPMVALLRRLVVLDIESLERQLLCILKRQITDPQPYENSSQAAKFLFKDDVVLIFDLADAFEADGRSVHSCGCVSALKTAVRRQTDDAPQQPTGKGIFGEPIYKLRAKMPQIMVEKLGGNVVLRALLDSKACQFRYGKIEAETCPVGDTEIEEMSAAFRWLRKRSRRGQTWQDIAGTCGFTRRGGKKAPLSAVLFAYPTEFSGPPPEAAALFGGAGAAEDADGSTFEACAARVIAAIDGLAKEHPNAEIEIFVLLKRDKARTKVLVDRRVPSRKLIDCAKSWQDGAENVPRIVLNLGTDENKRLFTPWKPFPSELVICLNEAWHKSDRQPDRQHEKVQGLGIGDGIALLVDDVSRAKSVITRALNIAVRNASPILLKLGLADCLDDGRLALSETDFRHARCLPSILGLLLSKLSITKGDYMHSAPFLVGRMLSLADVLHKEYCIHVRSARTDETKDGSANTETDSDKKPQIPRQLLGNATMGVAMERPVAGLARLAERLPVYQAWAETASGGGVGLAKWCLSEMAKVSNDLHGIALPERCDDAAKAQMLLGYLARPASN